MKLRTGKPVWLEGKDVALPVARLSRAITHCDVAIIGAGITGALVADQLLRAGLSVVMVDKRRAGYGSTAASTGLLMVQPDSSIGELTRRHDRRTARRVYQLGQRAIRDLGRLIRELKLDCGWAARRTLYVASNRRGAALLRAEHTRSQRIGFPAELVSAERLGRDYDLSMRAALAAPGAAEVNAWQLTRGLLRRALRHPEFALFQNTRVTSFREQRDTVELRTHDRGIVQARYLIVAAGYESRQFVRSKLIRLRSTYVIASPPFSPARLRPLRALLWETARPYFYLRTTADHRIIFGGRDDPFDTQSGQMRRLRRKTRELEAQFSELWPKLAFSAEYAWSGTFAETTDGLPCIGPKDPGSRVYYALGYGGNGITFSQIAARLLRDACTGRKNPDADLFAFRRLRSGRHRKR